MTLPQLYEVADRVIARLLKRNNITPPCCAGCFHCCHESVMADAEEVKFMLDGLSAEARAQVAHQAKGWSEKFFVSPFVTQPEPEATDYRAAKLWCPFLIDGKCSAYDRRPLACRLHVALKDAQGCIDDKLRPQQKFALFPELAAEIGMRLIHDLKSGESLTSDHLGVLLHEELTGEQRHTAARLKVTADGTTLTIEKYDEVSD